MAEDPELDFALLPEEMRSLGPLIARYAESDDVVRENLLAAAAADDLQQLADAAEPHWDAINKFLDENIEVIGPRQDLALALDSFAQAAMEARMEREQRHRS
jgi:hypothetical protein